MTAAMGKFKTDKDNHNWKGGSGISDKGYLRIYTRRDRLMYVHRAVMRDALKNKLCADYVFPQESMGPDGIPVGMTVNHADSIKTHNCLGNLQLLDKQIHDAISFSYWKFMRTFANERWDEYVEWCQEQDKERWE